MITDPLYISGVDKNTINGLSIGKTLKPYKPYKPSGKYSKPIF